MYIALLVLTFFISAILCHFIASSRNANAVFWGVLGAVFGPLSYIAGQRLGAIELVDYRSSLIALAVIWALAMPILTFAAGHYDRIRKPALVPLQRLSGGE